MRRLNDEQLSRVLSAHDNAVLEIAGLSPLQIEAGRLWGCLVQVSLCKMDPFAGGEEWSDERAWFDFEWKQTWSTDEFLAQLEKAGLA